MLPFFCEIILCFIVSYHVALLVLERKTQRSARSNQSRLNSDSAGTTWICRPSEAGRPPSNAA